MVYIPRYSRERTKAYKWLEMHEALGMLKGHGKFKRDFFLIADESEIAMHLSLMMMLRSDQAEGWSKEQAKEKIKQFKDLAKDCVGSLEFNKLLDEHYPGAIKKYWNDPDRYSKL